MTTYQKQNARSILSVFALLFACSFIAWGPWGGGGSSTPAGGGAVQGVPTSTSFTPPTFGTCVTWSPLVTVNPNGVFCPATIQTGWWYQPSGSCTAGATEPAWCAAYGCQVTDGSCTWTATGTTNPQPGQWTTALDFDWTQGSHTSFSTDGPFTFGGITWTKQNSAGETVHASAGGGTGLNLQPNSGVNYANTVRTMPMIVLPVQSIIPGATWTTPYRIMLWEAASNASSAGNMYLEWGIDHGDVIRPMVGALYYNTSTASGMASVANGVNASHAGTLFVNAGYTANSGDWTATRMLELEFTRGFMNFMWNAYAAPVPAFGRWPAQSSFTPFYVQNYGQLQAAWLNTIVNTMFPAPATGDSSPTTMAQQEFFFGAQAGAAGFSVTINRIRIDYKQSD